MRRHVNSLETSIRLVMAVLISPTAAYAQDAVSQPAAWWTLIGNPLLTAVIGLLAAFVAIRFDARKSINQELIKKRIAFYDDAAPKLNDLLCFFLIRGAWRTLQPPKMIERKRELDKLFHIYGPLFADDVLEQYEIFIGLCFKTFYGCRKRCSDSG